MRKSSILGLTLLITILLTFFFYIHEDLPQPLRALTAFFGTPVALLSGAFYFLGIEIPVYETPVLVVFANAVAAILLVFVIFKINNRKKMKA